MRVITRESLAADAAERWKSSYFRRDEWGTFIRGSSEQVYNALVALGASPKPDDVDGVVGNSSWTNVPDCNECGQDVDLVVEVGEPDDYESRTAFLCLGCIQAAASLAGAGISK